MGKLRQYKNSNYFEDYFWFDNPFLVAGLDELDKYWTEISLRSLRGDVDNYLPEELRTLCMRSAYRLTYDLATEIFRHSDPLTGLIAFGRNGNSFGYTRLPNVDGSCPINLLRRVTEFIDWTSDSGIRFGIEQLAKGIMKYSDPMQDNVGGIWNFLEVVGGRPKCAVVLAQDYTDVAIGLFRVTRMTANSIYQDWADKQMQFLWDKRLSFTPTILAEQLSPNGSIRAEGDLIDTDSLYSTRQLFAMARMFGKTEYAKRAQEYAELWFDVGWNRNYKHYIRKLNIYGKAASDVNYGDGKYNTLRILTDSYLHNKDRKYMDRWQSAWEGLLSKGGNGLIPERVSKGNKVVADGDSDGQTFFIEDLIKAYYASGRSYFLNQAQSFGKKVLEAGRSKWRTNSGQAGTAFLQVAMATGVRRIELAPPYNVRISNFNGELISTVSHAENGAVIYTDRHSKVQVTTGQVISDQFLGGDSNPPTPPILCFD